MVHGAEITLGFEAMTRASDMWSLNSMVCKDLRIFRLSTSDRKNQRFADIMVDKCQNQTDGYNIHMRTDIQVQ